MLFFVSACSDQSKDNSLADIQDSINAAAKTATVEKLPPDWSDFYYCNNIDSALKYPDKVHDLQLLNYDFKKLPAEITKLSKLEAIQFCWCYYFDLADAFNKLSKIPTLRKVEILDYCSKSLPKEISKLKQLKEFSWTRDSCLTTIPSEISQLDSLKYLSLQGTFTTFPRQILKLKNLTTLDLGGCKINQLPKDIDQLQSLDTLKLYANDLQEFPESIINLKKLKLLYFDQNPVAENQYYVEDLQAKMPACKVLNYTVLTFK